MEILFGLICSTLYIGGIVGLSAGMKHHNAFIAGCGAVSIVAGSGLISWMIIA
jgi:hypothetical protein